MPTVSCAFIKTAPLNSCLMSKTRPKLTGKYFIKNDTINFRYNKPQLKERVYQIIITGKTLYTPFILDGKGMQIQYNNLPR